MSETNYITTKAKDLLKLHGGKCSVREDSDLGREYRRLEATGEVNVELRGMAGYIRVTEKDYRAPYEQV